MSETLILVLALVAGAACPLHMWWVNRRGEQAACCPPRKQQPETAETLRARQAQLSAQIDELTAAGRPDRSSART